MTRATGVAGAVLALLALGACERVHEPWMTADAEAKQQWLSPTADERGDALRNRLEYVQTDR